MPLTNQEEKQLIDRCYESHIEKMKKVDELCKKYKNATAERYRKHTAYERGRLEALYEIIRMFGLQENYSIVFHSLPEYGGYRK